MAEKQKDVYYFSGTHWDREWYQTFQAFRFRLVKVLDDVVRVMEEDPEFGVFHLDGQTIVLEDYQEINPQGAEKLKKLIAQDRIKIGPWYVMPGRVQPVRREPDPQSDARAQAVPGMGGRRGVEVWVYL